MQLRRVKANVTALCAIVCLSYTNLFAAQDPKPAYDHSTVPEWKTVRATAPPVIDGDLSDEVWAAAQPIEEFTQKDPEEGKPSTEKTSVRVLYDDHAIYFGARLESTSGVTALLGRRDTYLESDWFRVYLDPHLDHNTGASFWVNPANVQRDMILFNDGWDDPNWDGVWSSATKIDDKGWSVEMRIPYTQLRFPDRPVHTWGANFARNIIKKNEYVWAVLVPKNESGFISRFAHLNDLAGIKPKRSLELLPYGVARSDLRNTVADDDPYNEPSDFGGDFGLDLKYGLTSNLTLTGAINPDFGQVEADPAVVNLSQFETFFPEKRPFFIEGGNMFRFGQGGSNWNMNINFFQPNFFYSRRIGRSPQASGRLAYDFADIPGETTILGAGKITGKTKSGWTIAALDALTSEENAFFTRNNLRDSAVVEPMTNYFVTRMAKDIGKKGRVGMLFTSVNRDLSDELSFLRKNAYSGGIDGYWVFGNRDVILEGFVGGTLVDGSRQAILETQNSPGHYYGRPDADHVELDPSRTSLSGWTAKAMLVKQTGKWRYNFQAQTYSPGFEVNDVGFMQRSDVTATHAALMYNDPQPDKYLRRKFVLATKYQNWNTAGDKIADGLFIDMNVTLKNYWSLFLSPGFDLERYNDRDTRGGPVTKEPFGWWTVWGVNSDSRKKFSAGMEQFNWRDDLGSYDHNIGFNLTYRPTSNLNLSVNPSFYTNRQFAQYVRTAPDPTALSTYKNRYVFADIDRKTLEIGTRVDWTFTSKLSFQLYLQPFIASGDYYNFKELVAPRTFDYAQYGRDAGTIVYDEATNRYTVDPDGDGAASSFRIQNPDFNFRSVRGNGVVRWEFLPGSALYFVWNENRQDFARLGDFSARRDLSAVADAKSDDVFMIKVSYYLGL